VARASRRGQPCGVAADAVGNLDRLFGHYSTVP
jgi:hypothetical protein